MVSVFYAKTINKHGNNQGVVARLKTRNGKDKFYSIQILGYNIVALFLGSTIRGKLRLNRKSRIKYNHILNADNYVGWWVGYVGDHVVTGQLGVHHLNNPLIKWKDSEVEPDIEELVLEGKGVGSMFRAGCTDFTRLVPAGVCRENTTCPLPNTQCTEMAGDLLLPFMCECMQGYQPIPHPLRTIERGCYDPIESARTVGGKCLVQKHCDPLPNTICGPTVSETVKVCQCVHGTKPSPSDSSSGLVLGCQGLDPDDLTSMASCSRKIEMKRELAWTPRDRITLKDDTLATRTKYAAFYVNFHQTVKETSLLVRLMSGDLSEEKFYSVHISSAGEVGIFENFKVHHWLGDFKKEERRAKVQTAGIIKGEWIGMWVRVEYVVHLGTRVEVGYLAGQPTISWTDSASNNIQDISVAGFGATHNLDLNIDCSIY